VKHLNNSLLLTVWNYKSATAFSSTAKIKGVTCLCLKKSIWCIFNTLTNPGWIIWYEPGTCGSVGMSFAYLDSGSSNLLHVVTLRVCCRGTAVSAAVGARLQRAICTTCIHCTSICGCMVDNAFRWKDSRYNVTTEQKINRKHNRKDCLSLAGVSPVHTCEWICISQVTWYELKTLMM